MPDRPRDPRVSERRPTPAALGVQIPPSRKLTSPGIAPPSLPPEDRELVLEHLRRVSETFASFRDELTAERGRDLQWRSGVEDRLDEHTEDIRALRVVALEWREMRSDLRDINKRLHEDSRDDVMTARELGTLKAEVARSAAASGAAAGVESGHDAGSRAGKKWGLVGIALTLGALTLENCGPALIKMLRGPAVDVPVAK